jgi:hypothetical protein
MLYTLYNSSTNILHWETALTVSTEFFTANSSLAVDHAVKCLEYKGNLVSTVLPLPCVLPIMQLDPSLQSPTMFSSKYHSLADNTAFCTPYNCNELGRDSTSLYGENIVP